MSDTYDAFEISPVPTPGPDAVPPEEAPMMGTGFACVLGEVDSLAAACRSLDPDSVVVGPQDTPWNTRDIEVITPERARVVLTAGKPFDPDGAEAQHLAEIGITR